MLSALPWARDGLSAFSANYYSKPVGKVKEGIPSIKVDRGSHLQMSLIP
jgi:hypothetical protein